MAYDPKKAHEYYMKHRKLKGRKKKSSSGLSLKVKKTKKKKGSKKTKKLTLDGLNEAGKAAANDAQAKINVEKKALTKKINEEMKKRISDLKTQMQGMTDTEKAVAVEKIKLEYNAMKKAANAKMKERYNAELQAIHSNKDYK